MMAVILPFRGVRYNTDRVTDVSSVISQPYDRVRYGLQEKYYDLSPYNVVRIIKGKELGNDLLPDDPPRGKGRRSRLTAPSAGRTHSDARNVYTRARVYYDLWCAEEVLRREGSPALYVCHQTFTVDGRPRTRKAFIAAFELTPFDEGIVFPHEQTHSGPKVDRLHLLRTLELNTGLIFMLYPDPQNVVPSILDAVVAGRAPDIDAVEIYEKDVRQQVWVVQDPDAIQAVQQEMAVRRNLIIADGHHRYETALAYRDERRRERRSANAANAPHARPGVSRPAYNYCMAALVSMDDPGLVILPTHREVLNSPHVRVNDVLARAGTLFDILPAADVDACLAEMAANEPRHAFGLYAEGSFHVLVLKRPEQIEQIIPGNRSVTWKSLDVSIAQKALLEQVIGLSQQAIELQTHLSYHRDPQQAIDNVHSGLGNLVLLLNPTRIDQVRACAQEGVKMPPKSTDFYPKMVAGLTMMPVGKGERL
jgi:uncharacterized protein (DUF1015 family)